MSDETPWFSFVVPGEPMPKERAEPTVGKRRTEAGEVKHFVRFRPGERTAEYEDRVRLIAQSARPSNWPLRCRYRVDLAIRRSEKGDKDNYEKAILDAVNPRRAKFKGKGASRITVRPAVPGVLWIDDAHVYEGSQTITDVDPTEACIAVHVTAIPVACELKTCGGLTFYPDDDGRCPTCAAKTEEKRARRGKAAA